MGVVTGVVTGEAGTEAETPLPLSLLLPRLLLPTREAVGSVGDRKGKGW